MNFLKNSLFILFGLILITSCGKNEILDKDIKEEVQENFDVESHEVIISASLVTEDDCFEFMYPIRFIMPDGSIVIAESDEDTGVKDWYEANPEAEERPEMVFPIAITFETELTTVQDKDELVKFKDLCSDKWTYKENCFTFIYPISFNMPDGTIVDIEDNLDLGLKDWYEANPDSDEKPTLVYPIEVKFKEEILPISNDDELGRIKDACDDWKEESAEKLCFDFVFPLSFSMGDGVTITGDTPMELREALQAWKEANPDAEVKPELIYPVQIIYEDGTVKDVETQEQLREASKDC